MKTTRKIIAVLLSLIFALGSISVMASASFYGSYEGFNVKYERESNALTWDEYTEKEVKRYRLTFGDSMLDMGKSTKANLKDFSGFSSSPFKHKKICLFADCVDGSTAGAVIFVSTAPDVLNRVDFELDTKKMVGKSLEDSKEYFTISSESPVELTSNSGYYKVEARLADGDSSSVEKFKANTGYLMTVRFNPTGSSEIDSFTDVYVNGEKVEMIEPEGYSSLTGESDCFNATFRITTGKLGFFASIIQAIRDFFAKLFGN